jgi:hypothetical protein
MSEERDALARFHSLVTSPAEFDQFVADAMPELVQQASAQTKRFLRGTGQWVNDVSHEKLALRWGYELVERFLVLGRMELPCRPFLALDSMLAKHYSQLEPLWYHIDLLSPLGRFLDGLTSRAVISRDALMALFYHFYGFSQVQVAWMLGLSHAETQRVYKNFERWRQTGWQRTMDEIGLTGAELAEIEEQKRLYPERINEETDRLIRLLQPHYRKSEPDHYPCLARQQWSELCEHNSGYDYRVWHLAFCRDCFCEMCDLRNLHADGISEVVKPRIDIQVRPLPKNGTLVVLAGRERYEKRRKARWNGTFK